MNSVYRKPRFSVIYAHFNSLFSSTYKIGSIQILLYRCFWICSDQHKFHLDLVKLMDVFKSSGCLENFISNCFKTFLDNKHRIQKKVITVPDKPFVLVLLYLGPLSLQTRTKFRKSLKGIPNCCKLQIAFKSQNKLANAFKKLGTYRNLASQSI